MTRDQLDAIADAFTDLFRLLRDADPPDKAELYSQIRLWLTYQPGPETIVYEQAHRRYALCAHRLAVVPSSVCPSQRA
ncbi:hypothetical protein KRM28CT15_26270 [Krasilnikovia sp. M28-CT-15]